MSFSERAELYAALAEALAEPPEWLCLAGREWPLFELATQLLPDSAAVAALALIQPESMPDRKARYANLSGGRQASAQAGGQPAFWLSESAFLTGRILGEATFEVAKCYSQSGLQVEGSELPDGAATELAFLASLVENNNPVAEQDFLKQHASRWLPALGQALAQADDPLYAAIGQLLSDWITQAARPARPLIVKLPVLDVVGSSPRLPVLSDVAACSLCGFCAQRCPTGALTIRETDRQTGLVLLASACTSCGRCVRACEMKPSLISMQASVAEQLSSQPVVLVLSERVACQQCGKPMVSQAEMDFVISKIGHPDWLDFCDTCRVPAQISSSGQ